eukprot:3754359-Amphidinium_carterae.1
MRPNAIALSHAHRYWAMCPSLMMVPNGSPKRLLLYSLFVLLTPMYQKRRALLTTLLTTCPRQVPAAGSCYREWTCQLVAHWLADLDCLVARRGLAYVAAVRWRTTEGSVTKMVPGPAMTHDA